METNFVALFRRVVPALYYVLYAYDFGIDVQLFVENRANRTKRSHKHYRKQWKITRFRSSFLFRNNNIIVVIKLKENIYTQVYEIHVYESLHWSLKVYDIVNVFCTQRRPDEPPLPRTTWYYCVQRYGITNCSFVVVFVWDNWTRGRTSLNKVEINKPSFYFLFFGPIDSTFSSNVIKKLVYN